MNIIFDRFKDGLKKAVTMSFDDGVVQDIRLAEIFNKYGVKGTFHICSGLLGTGRCVKSDEVENIYSGHEIATHTLTHQRLTHIPDENIILQCIEDRKNLEKIAGYPVKGMSYPFGSYNEHVIDILKSCGIKYSRTINSTKAYTLPNDFMKWDPTCHYKQDVLDIADDFIKSNYYKTLQTLYVWGHAYEFDDNNNWHIIEEFCKKITDTDDIWFATNMEIYDYVRALKNLEFSADMSVVENKSAIDVYISADGEPVKIPANTLIKL